MPDLELGFRELYDILRSGGATLTGADGPLAAFADDDVRVLRRSTVEYGAVLDTSLHPDLLRDGLDLDRHFDRLWRRTAVDPALAAFVSDERADLWNNDIPSFSAQAAGREIRSSRGHPLPLRLDSSPVQAVLANAYGLGDAGLSRQTWLLRASVLADLTKEPEHLRAAGRATTTLRAQIARGDLRQVGGMAGLGGAVYALVRLALLGGDERLLAEAAGLLDAVCAAAADDTALDVVGGSAGSIGGLLALHAVRPSDRVLSAVRVCADRLVARSAPAGPGVGWLPAAFVETGIADRPLSGFAHGNAGMAWALGHAGVVLADPRLLATARAALSYERSLYDPGERNWLDLRTDPAAGGPPAAAFMTAWCHGAGGIGMSRLGLTEALGAAETAAEAGIALDTVRRSGFGLNHSLCHGDLGNLDLLVQAGTGDAERRERLDTVLATVDRYGVIPGTPLAVETPGLLTGLAGIGYGLLRAARPDVVPSVLTLQPFPANRTC